MRQKIKIIVAEEIIRDQRVIKEAKYISNIGYDVEILCWDREEEFIMKEIEIIDKVKIKRFFPQALYGSGWKQIIPFIKTILRMRRYLKNQEYEYLHCQNLDGFIMGYLINRKAKIIFDMRELYLGRESNIVKKYIIKVIVRFANHNAWKIIHVNNTQISEMDETEKSKLVYLPNYPEASLGSCKKNLNTNYLNVSYIGGVRQYKIFENLMIAVQGIENINVDIHGGGVAYKPLKEIEHMYQNINIKGRYDPCETASLYSSADIIYCVYSMDNLNWKTAYPIKFYESIITKTPVVVSKGSVLEGFVKKYDIGFVVDGNNIKEIHKLLKSLSNDRKLLQQKVRNIEKIQFKYCWEEVVSNLDMIYNPTLFS